MAGEDAFDLFTSAREAIPDSEPVEPEPTVLSVSELNRAVRSTLEGALGSVWVEGEIGSWTRAGSGHRYFSLKDDSAELRCVMWRSEASRLPMDPEVGLQVRVYGDPTLYEAKGTYQLRARQLESAGAEGLWRMAFEKLRAQLLTEGLLAPERKKKLPAFPRTVGVVTSTSGAALHDILSVLARRAPWTRVVVRNARVQGEGAAAEIAAAVRFLDAAGEADVLIVGRGGGSIEDLWAFNEEPVARAIADCSTPVVSAVGHEVDVTISDLVADLRAPTPSAAAEAVVQDGAELRHRFTQIQIRMRRGLRAAVDSRRRRLETSPTRLVQALRVRTGPLGERLDRSVGRLTARVAALLEDRRRRAGVGDRLVRGVQGQLRRSASDVGKAAARLHALSPLATLERGYAIPLDGSGQILRRVRDFETNVEFTLRVADGRVDCRVSGTEELEEA